MPIKRKPYFELTLKDMAIQYAIATDGKAGPRLNRSKAQQIRRRMVNRFGFQPALLAANKAIEVYELMTPPKPRAISVKAGDKISVGMDISGKQATLVIIDEAGTVLEHVQTSL